MLCLTLHITVILEKTSIEMLFHPVHVSPHTPAADTTDLSTTPVAPQFHLWPTGTRIS